MTGLISPLAVVRNLYLELAPIQNYGEPCADYVIRIGFGDIMQLVLTKECEREPYHAVLRIRVLADLVVKSRTIRPTPMSEHSNASHWDSSGPPFRLSQRLLGRTVPGRFGVLGHFGFSGILILVFVH